MQIPASQPASLRALIACLRASERAAAAGKFEEKASRKVGRTRRTLPAAAFICIWRVKLSRLANNHLLPPLRLQIGARKFRTQQTAS